MPKGRWSIPGAGALCIAGMLIAAPGDAQQASGSALTAASQPQDAKSIVDHRCVVCHSCYDAPCQLKLTSTEGVLRGASQQIVYDTGRLQDAAPTRLGVDATAAADWRALGFFPVAPAPGQTGAGASLIERYLELGRQAPLPANAPLPQALGLDLDRPLACPAPQDFDAYRAAHPQSGMPYAMAPLSDQAFETLMDWARDGAALPVALPPLSAEVQVQIATWEAFLNSDAPRAQLVNRYIYEHLFLAHIALPGDDPGRFFELVRSATGPGEEIDLIATRRPFDPPGVDRIYYRLRPVTETIVHKEHLVYPLDADRLARFQTLFLDPDWSLAALPGYGETEGGNPFSTFAAIPARSRYQFLLDDALFFVRSFIRGPVCHGQTAVDVIEDRFWVSFLDPEADLAITDPNYLKAATATLELPVSLANRQLLGQLQSMSHANQARFLAVRDAAYQSSPAHQAGFDLDAIWDGEGTNPDALITVFRHYDNASAIAGFHGDIPETAWVIDYPIFERIFYDLVAGYDVFGRVEHQLATRLYMDELRMESEDTFLAFMPQAARRTMHAGWYRGLLAQIHTYWHKRRVDDTFATGIAYETLFPKREFFMALLERGNGLWPMSDPINRCQRDACPELAPDDPVAIMRELADAPNDWVKYLPDLSVLLIEDADGSAELFTLVHDKAHKNVAFIFNESSRREPDDDLITVFPGLIGSYPNFFFRVDRADLADFAQSLAGIRTQDDWMATVAQYGVRRTSPAFWAVSDRIHGLFQIQSPGEAGILDLNRYQDPKAGDAPT
ncbi:MAG: fatty acid cis/trans isomerase [Pseudomonadota bacterium]